MNTDNWEGAQWVLVTLMLMATVLPIILRVGGFKTKPFNEWLGGQLAELVERISLIFILWWGGFWS